MAETKKTSAKKKATSTKKSASARATSAQTLVGHGVGRRKSAVARVWLHRGAGDINVNGLDFQVYFDTEKTRADASKPLTIFSRAQGYDVKANIQGGGKTAQADALKLGIARAFLEHDESLRSELRNAGLLTVDSRNKERKKPGQPAARKKFQFVKR